MASEVSRIEPSFDLFEVRDHIGHAALLNLFLSDTFVVEQICGQVIESAV
jgi:hypothetical protein